MDYQKMLRLVEEMRRPVRRSIIATLILCVLTISVGFAQPNSAIVRFGNNTAPGADQNCERSGQVPPEDCARAYFRLIPDTVSIRAGGTVTFNNEGTHQVVVYNAGIRPQQIVPESPTRVVGVPQGGITPFECGEPDEPELCPINVKYVGAQGTGSDTFVFAQPGQYLVICNFRIHFEQGMWGWVNVN